jgi:acyl carrier protein
MQTFINDIQRILYKKLNIHPRSFTIKTDFRKGMELTDWEIAYLLNVIEESYQIEISDKDVHKINNVHQLVNIVKKAAK